MKTERSSRPSNDSQVSNYSHDNGWNTMPSNVLSIKAFDTKTPVLCHPPPLLPGQPPGPILDTTFYVNASLEYQHPVFPASFTAAAYCKYKTTPQYWWGISSTDPDIERIACTLWHTPPTPIYSLTITFMWPGPHSRYYEWRTQQFYSIEHDRPALSGERPYTGGLLEWSMRLPFRDEATATTRELPT